jgi:4-hydroxybenzoate polyprenyltransferase
MKLLRFLIHTNLFISAAAVLFTMETQVQLGDRPAFHPYLFIIFFATLFEYNLHRLITLAYHPNALSSPKHEWLRENRRSFYLLVFFSVAGFVIAICYAKTKVLMALLPIAILTLFYTLPVFRIKEKLLRLREIPGLKIFMIAFVWSAVTVLLPVIQSETTYDWMHISLMILERCFFIFAITIPFDIRDLEADTRAGLKTLPVIYGHKKAIFLANAATFVFMGLSSAHYLAYDMPMQIPACLLSGLVTLACLNNKKLQASDIYHYGVLDGCISIQALIAIAFYFLS